MMAGTLAFVVATYVVMLAAFFLRRHRMVHMPVMATIMVIDFLFPIYLVLTKDWYRRLIEQEEIFSFMIWMHFMLVLTLYALYVLQILTVGKLLKGDVTAKAEHRSQGVGILIARGLVIASSALLIEPPQQS